MQDSTALSVQKPKVMERGSSHVLQANTLLYLVGEVTSSCFNCCRKTAVCNGDQLVDFSVPELLRSQSTFSTDPEVLQNCASFTVSECSAVLGLTQCMLHVQIYCVLRVMDY